MRPLSHFSPALLALSLLLPLSLRGEGTFTFTVLDIPDIQRGAGLAVVMQTPSGKTFLYDTGSGYPMQLSSDGWSGNFNAGRDLIAPFLKKAGIGTIDGVLISHGHYDHFGGLLWLDEHFRPAKLIDPGFTYQGDSDNSYLTELTDYDKLRAKYVERGTYQAANTGDLLELDEALHVEVIAPPKTFFPDHQVETRSKQDSPAHYLLNANSLGIRIQHGDIVFYLPGDIQTEDIDLSLLPSIDPARIKCHVLVAPGHGIHCTPAFAEATRPEVSIASVFERYAKGLKSTPMLKAVGAKTYITGLHGDIRIVSDGKRYTVESARPLEQAVAPPPSQASGKE